MTRQSGSWRQAIFNRVVTPSKNLSGKQPVSYIGIMAERHMKQ